MMWKYSDGEYIKLYRKILNWEWYSDPCTRGLFEHCLLKANWKDGEWKGYKYKRGQFITSLPTLSEELGFSVQNVRTALKRLKSTGEITDWHDNKVRIITVINYDKYQGVNSPANSLLTDNQQATNRQLTADIRSKEYKNYKEEKEKPAAPSFTRSQNDENEDVGIDLFNMSDEEYAEMKRKIENGDIRI